MGTYHELRKIIAIRRAELIAQQFVRFWEQRSQQRFNLRGSITRRAVQGLLQEFLILLVALVPKHVAVVNSTMARQYWPHGDALGKQLRLPELKAEPPFSQAVPDCNSWLQIIGIVADARDDGLRKPVKPAVFVPFSLRMGMWTQILVKTRVAPLGVLNRVRAEVKAIDPDQQLFGKHLQPSNKASQPAAAGSGPFVVSSRNCNDCHGSRLDRR
jgi:hypothetical protein